MNDALSEQNTTDKVFGSERLSDSPTHHSFLTTKHYLLQHPLLLKPLKNPAPFLLTEPYNQILQEKN